MKVTFELNEDGLIVIDNQEYALITDAAVYNIVESIPNCVSDEDLDRPIPDLDSGIPLTLREVCNIIRDDTLLPGKVK